MSAWIDLDRASLLVHVSAGAALGDLERALGAEGLSLGLDLTNAAPNLGVGAWIEAGAPGARDAWLDPADHLIAGFSARIAASGEAFVIHPGPRRAVGPDLSSLLSGARGRFVALESVWLRVHRKDAPRPMTEAFASDDPTMDPSERALFDRIDDALRR